MKRGFLILIVLLSLQLQGQTVNWSVPTLKEYVDQRFNSMQEAVNKSEISVEKRFSSVNEFRATLSDQQRTFVSRAEYESVLNALLKNDAELKERLDKYESMRSGGSATIAYLMAAIGFLIALVALSRNFIASVTKQAFKTDK